MSVSINGTGGITFADASTQSTGGYTGFRNRIINGAMMIDQRNSGASVTPTATAYTLDRWRLGTAVASKVSVQQSNVAPDGFTNSTLITSLSAYNISGTGHEINFGQRIEGFNTSDLGWGTANAKPVTFSFWVRSSLTGLFSGAIKNIDATRCYVFSYTINTANTWEQKSITIVGDTSGTWNTANNVGMIAQFCIASDALLNTAGIWYGTNTVGVTGTTQLVATNGATFYITGVQLEAGSVATPFEFRPYGQELALCQRYYQQSGFAFGASVNTTLLSLNFSFPVILRASPTASFNGGSVVQMGGSSYSLSSISTPYFSNSGSVGLNMNTGTIPIGSYVLATQNAVSFSAEL